MKDNLGIKQEHLEEAVRLVEQNPNLLLQIPDVVKLLTSKRIEELNKKDIKVYDNPTDGVNTVAIPHNIDGILKADALLRPSRLLAPLMGIDRVYSQRVALKVLDIGARTEAELFQLVAMGFHPSNITAVDLLSYSDHIELGDMHDLKFADGTFDVTIAGWVLAYSRDNVRAAKEIARVTKSGGYIVVGCVSEPLETWENRLTARTKKGGIPMETIDPNLKGEMVSRFFHISQLTNLFADHIDEIVFKHQHDKRDSTLRSNVALIFKKK